MRKASSGFLTTAWIFSFQLGNKNLAIAEKSRSENFSNFRESDKIRFGFSSEFFGFRKNRVRGCRGVLLPKCRFVKLRLTKWLLSIAKLFVARQFEIRFNGANLKFSKKWWEEIFQDVRAGAKKSVNFFSG